MLNPCVKCTNGVKNCPEEGNFGEFEQLILQCAFGEYCTQLTHGIAISQVEVIRPHDMGLGPKECHEVYDRRGHTL